MTMLSFRADDEDVERAGVWAERLGIDRSEFLREALRQYLNRLASQRDAETWVAKPLSVGEQAIESIADWGPAEDWSDWNDETR